MENNKLHYGNDKDRDIFESKLTVTEFRELNKMLCKMGMLLQKCDLGEYVFVEYKYSDDGDMKCFIASHTDTGEYTDEAMKNEFN